MSEPNLTNDGRTVTVRVPIAIRRRGGRKLVLAPGGAEVTVPITRHVDNAMVKAIARAFRWRDMLESGEYATIREIAAAEKINETYVGRVLRLTLLAPDLVEVILGGRQPAGLQLDRLLTPSPIFPLNDRSRACHAKAQSRAADLGRVDAAGCCA
jgi:hypothetical protein